VPTTGLGATLPAHHARRTRFIIIFSRASHRSRLTLAVGPDAKRTAGYGGHLNLQYGEVRPSSMHDTVLARMGRLGPTDVFYDLGSGTGKIPLMAALWTGAGRSVGVEYAAVRHGMALEAYARLASVTAEALLERAIVAELPLSAAEAEAAAAELRSVLKDSRRLQAVHGDFLTRPLDDATAVFINNTVFEAALRLPLESRLAGLPRLRRLAVIKELCPRHSARCELGGASCCAFVNPPERTTCKVRGG
jgi:hypothetical protein